MNAKFSDSVREGLGLYGSRAIGMTSGVLMGVVRMGYGFMVTMSGIGIVVCTILALLHLTSWSHAGSMLFWNVTLVVGRHVLSTWGMDQLNRLFGEPCRPRYCVASKVRPFRICAAIALASALGSSSWASGPAA